MLILIKLISLFLLIAFTLFTSGSKPETFLIITGILLAIAAKLRLSLSGIAQRNVFILIFIIIFSSFALISGYLNSYIDYGIIALTSVKILLIYNIVYIGGYWLGKNGFLYIVNSMPFFRLKLYLLFLYNILTSFIRRNQLIVYQLKSRLDLSKKKSYIARYYIQNLIMKEMYTIHLNQAAIITRINSDFDLYAITEKLKLHDFMIFMLIVLLIVMTMFVG